MLAAERRRVIADLVRQHSTVRVDDLCARLGASPSTIRRDLEYLERQEILKRTYGGAIATTGTTLAGSQQAPPPFPTEKARIGAAAAGLIAEGETVFLGSGSTALAVASHIIDHSSVTVVTNALSVAAYLTAHSQLPVILTGGQIERRDTALLGHIAELTLRELRADRAIIGVGGIHMPDGVTSENLATVRFMRMVIDWVPETVVIADSSKWGKVGPAFLAPLEAVDVIVTDLSAPSAMVWDLSELGIKIIQT